MDAISHSAAISACEKSGEWAHSLLLLSDLQTLRAVDLIAYNAAISACAKGLKWQAAVLLFAQSLSGGPGADPITFEVAITSCAESYQWQQAILLLELRPGRMRMTVTR